MTDRFASEDFVGHQREVPIGLLQRTTLDARRPMLLSDHEHVLQVAAGHVDLFAVQPTGTRQHLFRVENGECILDLHNACETSGSRLQIIAVGPLGLRFWRCRVVQRPLVLCLAGLPNWQRSWSARRQTKPFPSW